MDAAWNTYKALPQVQNVTRTHHLLAAVKQQRAAGSSSKARVSASGMQEHAAQEPLSIPCSLNHTRGC
jgi:hypothetical protein